jgi:hypothetical protein
MTPEDPGWWPSLRGLWWYLIPILGEVMRARWWRKETNGLIVLRGRLLGFLVSLFLFVFAMSFIAPGTAEASDGCLGRSQCWASTRSGR